MDRKLKPDKCPQCRRGAGSRPLSHLSDGHVVLHVVVILQENKDGQEVSKGSNMRTDWFKNRDEKGRFCAFNYSDTQRTRTRVSVHGAAAARQTERKGKRD